MASRRRALRAFSFRFLRRLISRCLSIIRSLLVSSGHASFPGTRPF